MTASIARVRGRFGDLPVPLTKKTEAFNAALLDLIDAAVEGGLPLELVLGNMQVVSAAVIQGLFEVGAR